MSQPATGLPPDPMSQARDRMVEMAGETAKNMAMREMRSTLKGYVPRILWPLIPGERGTVEGNLKAAASKWAWGVVGSLVFSAVFFGIFAIAVLGFVAVTAYAVVTTM